MERANPSSISLFDTQLSCREEDIDCGIITEFDVLSWADFLLNPRRLRGSDFLMRWSQGEWSEHRLTQAVNAGNEFYAMPYGPSSTAPDNDIKAFELYFERLEQANLAKVKRPDLLLFRKKDQPFVDEEVAALGGVGEIPFLADDNEHLNQILEQAIVAIECENSLWVTRKMPDYTQKLTPQKRLNGQLGLKKTAVTPTIIIKEEDQIPLMKWQDEHEIPIHVWHAFYDFAYGIALDKANKLFTDGLILPTEQTFQAPNGVTTKKSIYKIYHHYAYLVGETVQQPELTAKYIEDKNGHILPYVTFTGGSLVLKEDALKVLRSIAGS